MLEQLAEKVTSQVCINSKETATTKICTIYFKIDHSSEVVG